MGWKLGKKEYIRDKISTAVANGDDQGLMHLLSKHKKVDLRFQDKFASGWPSLLHLAASQGYVEVIAILLLAGLRADDMTKPKGETALFKAVRAGSVECCQALLAAGANIEWTASGGMTPLFCAVDCQHLSVLECLYKNDAKARITDEDRNTALHHAASLGNLAICEFLLDIGCSSNEVNRGGSTPAALAAWNRHIDVVKLFLDRGVVLKFEDFIDRRIVYPPLVRAVRDRNQYVLGLLLHFPSARKYINDPDQMEGNSPLHWACLMDSLEMTTVLVEFGASLAMINESGATAIDIANRRARMGNEALAKYLNLLKHSSRQAARMEKEMNRRRKENETHTLRLQKERQQQDKQYSELLEEAKALMIKKPTKALKILRKCNAFTPPRIESVVLSATLCVKMKDYDLAEELVTKAIEINAKNWEARLASYKVKQARGEHKTAKFQLDLAVDLSPHAVMEPLIERARYHQHRNCYGLALEDLNKAIEKEKDNPELYLMRAELHESRNRPGAGEVDIKVAGLLQEVKKKQVNMDSPIEVSTKILKEIAARDNVDQNELQIAEAVAKAKHTRRSISGAPARKVAEIDPEVDNPSAKDIIIESQTLLKSKNKGKEQAFNISDVDEAPSEALIFYDMDDNDAILLAICLGNVTAYSRLMMKCTLSKQELFGKFLSYVPFDGKFKSWSVLSLICYYGGCNGNSSSFAQYVKEDISAHRTDGSSCDASFDGLSPLNLALLGGNADVFVPLFKRFPKYCSRNENNVNTTSPLHVAAELNIFTVIRSFIELNPELADAPDEERKTPLHYAAINGHQRVVDILIDKRNLLAQNAEASTRMRDTNGLLPHEYADKQGHSEILDALILFGRQCDETGVEGKNGGSAHRKSFGWVSSVKDRFVPSPSKVQKHRQPDEIVKGSAISLILGGGKNSPSGNHSKTELYSDGEVQKLLLQKKKNHTKMLQTKKRLSNSSMERLYG